MKKAIKLTDLHCHVLPGIDDGCKDCEESAKLIAESMRQGVRAIAATPHYYPTETVEAFLKRRNEAFDQLMDYAKEHGIELPEFVLGAEVAYRTGLVRERMLGRLCYGNSRFILLEMPFKTWSPSVLNDVEEIRLVHGLKPIIAHMERYAHYQDRKTLKRLYNMDVLIQMNAEYYLDSSSHRKAQKEIKRGRVHILGTDSHNTRDRAPNLLPAIEAMEQDGFAGAVEEILENNRRIFRRAAREQEE